MQTSMRKVLIVAYYFPPSGGAGVQRTLKFVKYLREFGWEPIVLTALDADYPVLDETLLDEIPADVKIYRSKIFEPYNIYRKVTGRSTSESTDIGTLSLDKKQKRKLSEAFSEWARATFFVPDARIGWRRHAVKMGCEILANEKVDLIYSSAPPYTTHLIGGDLARKSELPWIADFRDSWIGWVSAPQWRPWFSRKIEARMEANVLRQATKIITVSNGVRDDLVERNSNIPFEKWQLIMNGYDRMDFDGLAPKGKSAALTMTYSGSMYGARNPEFLVQALEKIYAEQPELLLDFRIRLIGRVGDPIEKRIHASSVSHTFERLPYLRHKESLEYLLASDVLLLVIDDTPANHGILTGKLFEYIGSGKPVFALAPEGDAARLIRKGDFGWIAPPANTADIEQALRKMFADFSSGTMQYNQQAALRKQFERRSQTAELARLFDKTLVEQKIARN